MKLSILIFSLSLWTLIGWADDSATPAPDAASPDVSAPDKDTTSPVAPSTAGTKSKKGQPNVLDFDGDVIEGERQAPNLFLQLQVDTPNLDVLLYQRKDFNDFHALEKDRRPLYRKVSQ
jgi:hypothetical protein